MIERTMTVHEAEVLEPMTTLALKRYDASLPHKPGSIEGILSTSVKDVNFILDLLNFYGDPSTEGVQKFHRYALSSVLDYLKRTHRYYIDHFLPKMEMAIAGLEKAFPHHVLVAVLKHFYANYQNELLEHIELEEQRLFPYAERLYDGKYDASYSVADFRAQHNHDVEDQLESILVMVEQEFSEVAESFAYRAFKHLLHHFRHDLVVHHFLEESVFLEKIKNLEEEELARGFS